MDASSPIYLLDKVWLFPALMAGSFLLILFVGKRLPEKACSAIGIGAVSICFVGSLFVGAQWINRVNHPPTGAEVATAQQACGVGGGEGSAGGGAENEGATTEHAAATTRPAAPVEGESAAVAEEPAGDEGG